MSKSKRQVNAEASKRGLVALMNDTKWAELQAAVLRELPFGPPYQIKAVLSSLPQPEQFDADVDYLGDWSDECLLPFYEIEWLRIRPRFVRRRGQLIEPEVQSVESDLLAILHRCHIPFRRDDDSIWIYGYANDTGDFARNS